MRFIAETRLPDGSKNVYKIDDATDHHDARNALLEAIDKKATVLVCIEVTKPRIEVKK